MILRDPEILLPGTGQGHFLKAALDAIGWTPDVLIPIWNYGLTAAAAELPCRMYTIYGNPDYKVYQANLALQWRWERRWRVGWLLRHLAERGEAGAAFALARTFDAEGLAELGGIGVAADQARAMSWYERAAKDGNDGAAKRLKNLASASH